MKYFRHVNASSVEEAVGILRDYKGHARIIAGGTDILGVLKDRILPEHPELLVNIKTIPELGQVQKVDGGIKIGSLVKLSDLANMSFINENYKVLAQAAHSVGTPQIRNAGTVGGNLVQDTRCWYYRYPHSIGGRLLCKRKGDGPCYAVAGDNRYHAIFGGKGCFAACPSDMATALLLLNAEIKTVGVNGSRTIYMQDFFTPLGTVLEPEEIISEIYVPEPSADAKQQFLKYSLRKPIDFAIVSVAALVIKDNDLCFDSRIVLGAVAPGPVRAFEAEEALKGERFNEDNIDKAAELSVKGAKPLSKNGYKVEIAQKLVARGLAEISNC